MIKNIEKIFKKANRIVQEKKNVDEKIQGLALQAIETENGELINIIADNFIDDLDDKTINKMINTLLKIGKANYIYDFACAVKTASVNKLAVGVAKTGDAFYIVEYAKNIKNAPVQYLADAIIKTKDAQGIYNFATEVEGAPIDKLAKAILKTNSYAEIEAFSYDVLQTSVENFGKMYGKDICDKPEDELE